MQNLEDYPIICQQCKAILIPTKIDVSPLDRPGKQKPFLFYECSPCGSHCSFPFAGYPDSIVPSFLPKKEL